jgi:malate dehydrogenase (oxaloacetate-decarboxylating)
MTTNDMLVRTIRVRNRHEPGVFGRLATAIGDQDTAAVTLAAVLNACRLAGRDPSAVQIGCIGLGAAGLSIATLLRDYTGQPVRGADIRPAALRRHEERGNRPATLEEVLACCDVVVATTGVKGLIAPEQVRVGQIILALSNPEPEITPDAALAAGAAYAADGTSVNNILGFPGLLRGALETRAQRYTPSMFVAAGLAIAAAEPPASSSLTRSTAACISP